MDVKTKVLYCAMAVLSTPALASEFVPPSVYGNVLGQIKWEDNKDYQSEIQSVQLGLLGHHRTDLVRVRYNIEAEYGRDLTAKTEQDREFDIRLSEANLILLNHSLGSLYFGNGTVGTYKDLYSKVDIFDSNNMKRWSGSTLYRQGVYGTNQIAYGTPIWNGLQFKGAIISPNDSNGNNVDVYGLRLIYNKGNFNATLNRASTHHKQLPANATEDYVRYAFVSSYQLKDFYLAGLVELNQDDPAGDSNVYGLSTKYQLNNVTFKLGAQFKDYDDASQNNETLYLANASYAFDKHFTTFVELAEYAEDSKNDRINIGLNFHF